ncbi:MULTISPECIES: DUF6879 family protein [unclassified Streptomyces]|uniref:DUF6879 family protein n=1 Tax=unclassified Streptomyces TaxID=2593676 RepID=UPI002258C61C|nr:MULTISPECIES: DUF6879 family protein [unclassified Streptomyces]MCX4866886.1 hypothetical protein [Streptomyces sp. NBC_00906]MCX4898124.1 hypothetical protein [Streptomyces sp. NBC_00892]
MARRLRFNGTGSGGTGCPSLHEDLDSREVIVHGPPLSDPEDVAQLQHLSEGEVAVVVPRELLVDYAPRDVTRAARITDLDEFENLFRTFKHTAWRLETRRRYASDEITDTYRQFTENGSADRDLEDPYCAMIRAQTEQGKRVERVRIADDPPTPGQLYLLDNAKRNTVIGEDIRNLRRAEAAQLGLPEEDFWIFDSRIVARLNFDPDDQLADVELITEPAEVVRCSLARDAAWHHAVPHEMFAASINQLD